MYVLKNKWYNTMVFVSFNDGFPSLKNEGGVSQLKKLYVGNLPYSVRDNDLEAMFADYGTITSAVVIMDRGSGRSKGFGFVEIEDDAMADKAIEEMNEKDVEGRNIVVNEARPRTE